MNSFKDGKGRGLTSGWNIWKIRYGQKPSYIRNHTIDLTDNQYIEKQPNPNDKRSFKY